MEKWNKMLLNFDDFHKNNFSKLKSRTRKGIPDCLRGLIWQKYANIDKYINDENLKNIYNDLTDTEQTNIEIESVILRDIDRTFPKHTFFKDKYGIGYLIFILFFKPEEVIYCIAKLRFI